MFKFLALTLGLVAGSLAIPAKPLILSEYQDSAGQYSFGYSSPQSARSEMRSLDGKTIGAFSYISSDGSIQTARYTADAENGFRIEASNLPQAPLPVTYTPEVLAAREEHLKALAESQRQEEKPEMMMMMEEKKPEMMMMDEKKSEMMMDEKKPEMMMEDKKPEMIGEKKDEMMMAMEDKLKEPLLLAKAAATPFVQSSFVLPASKINLQSRIELIPGSQYSEPSQGKPLEKGLLNKASSAAVFSATAGYSPNTQLLISPYAAYPYAHYPSFYPTYVF